MKIICVDNFDRETVSDTLVEENVTLEGGRIKCRELNSPESAVFYKVVDDDYVLYMWEP